MMVINLKRAIKVQLLDGFAPEPRYVTAKALRCADLSEFVDNERFVSLAVFEAVDSEGREWHVGRYPEGFDIWARPDGKTFDEWNAEGLKTRRPAMVKVALDNVEAVEDANAN